MLYWISPFRLSTLVILLGGLSASNLRWLFFELGAGHDFVLQLLRQIGFMIDHKKPTRIEHEYVHQLHACMYSMTNLLLYCDLHRHALVDP